MPVVSVCAVRTGSGKSQTTRRVIQILRKKGRRVVAIRHPMPYGDLVRQRVQRFATLEDLDLHRCTIEEREEYEPHIASGGVIYAGVDYGAILAEAEKEADVIVWDGGNNDLPFYKADLEIVVADPHRPGHELSYHPGEANLRRAHVVVINKIDTADAEGVAAVRRSIREVNPDAMVVDAASPISVDNPEAIRGKRVLAIEDGPTLTHGEMKYGAGCRRGDEVRRRGDRRPAPLHRRHDHQDVRELPGHRHAAARHGLRRGADAGSGGHGRADARRPGADRDAYRPAPHREDHETRAARQLRAAGDRQARPRGRAEEPLEAMKQKHLVSLKDYSRDDIEEIFALTDKLKQDPLAYREALRGKVARHDLPEALDADAGLLRGGDVPARGHGPVPRARTTSSCTAGRRIADTARVLSRYVDAIMARVFAHQDIMDLAKHGSVPVINGLSDLLHPVQALADYYTLRERRGQLEGLKLAYVGDGNNVCHELILGADEAGHGDRVRGACGLRAQPADPQERDPRRAEGERRPCPVVTADPMAGRGRRRRHLHGRVDLDGAGGRERERVSAFQGFMVSSEMMAAAQPDCVFMHCLPAHRGEEVAADVIDGPQSVVFDEAENRLHVQKALLLLLLGAA